jgi:hypothetical protein
MESKSILITDPAPARSLGEVRGAPEAAWKYLRMAGIVAVVVGMTDLLLAWMPLRVGTPEWEFGIATATMENLPLTMVGLTLILAAGLALDSRISVMTVAVVMLFLLVVVIVFTLLFALNVPLALKAVTSEPARTTLQKGMIKTGVQAMAYATFFGIVGVGVFRRGLRGKRGEIRRVAPVTG